MSSIDALIQTLIDAHAHLDQTRVWEAYVALTGQILRRLTGKPYTVTGALTNTQLVFIRHGLGALSPHARADLNECAAPLRAALNGSGASPLKPLPQVAKAAPPAPSAPPVAQTAPETAPRADDAPNIYLIATRRDAALLRRIQAELSAADLRVWADAGLQPGSEAWREGVECTMKSCGAVVVLLTPEAKQNQWVEQQLHYALAQNRTIFPLLARGEAKDSTPAILADHPLADIRREPSYRTTMRRLKRALLAFR
jgi:hypothetical protein